MLFININNKCYLKLLSEDIMHKSNIAINSAKMISKSILNIETECFRCHNLARDWK